MGMASPVRGLRPGRGAFWRIWKLPKPESFTSVPCTSVSLTSSKKASTMSLDSRLFKPSRSNSNSDSSALVSVGVSMVGSSTVRSLILSFMRGLSPSHASGPHARAHLVGQILQHGLHGGFDALIVERLFVVAQLDAHGQAALVFGDAGHRLLGLVDVE